MATLDLRAPSISIKFDKGKTLDPIFYYLSSTSTVINLSGYKARMVTWPTTTDVTPITGFSVTTEGAEGSKLTVVQGTATLADGTTVAGAWGIQIDIAAAITEAAEFTTALFEIELIVPVTLDVLPLVKGSLRPCA